MDSAITESGMDFVADNTFRIEHSPLYKNMSDGIRSVEFVRAKGDSLIFVEARTAFPRPDDDPNAAERGRFETVVNEICEKFVHSLNLFSTVKVGVAEAELPSDFTLPNRVTLMFVLVIRTHEQEWCRSIETAIVKVLPTYLHKIWKPTVRVLNYNTAVKHQLVYNRDKNSTG